MKNHSFAQILSAGATALALLGAVGCFPVMLYRLGFWGAIGTVVAVLVACCLTGLFVRKRALGVWGIMTGAFCVGLSVLCILDFHMGIRMTSDYYSAQRAVEAGRIICFHPNWCAYWCNYELFLSMLGKFLVAHLMTGQIVNLICLTLCIYPLYRIVERISGEKAAIAVSVLMGFSPALLAYGAFLTSEFLAVTMLFYAFYFFLKALEDAPVVRRILFAVGAGLLMMLSQQFKPVVPIFTCAAILTVILVAGMKGDRRAEMKFHLLILVVMLVSSWAFRPLADGVIRRYNPECLEVAAKQSAIPWGGLVVGLNLPTAGCWEQKISDLSHDLKPDEAKRLVLERASREWKGYPGLFARKFLRLYQGDHWVLQWLADAAKISEKGWGAWFVAGWYAVVYMGVLVGFLGLLLSVWRAHDSSFEGLMATLIVLGFTTLVMIIEYQGRYRMSIYPFYFIVMAYGEKLIRKLYG